MLGRGWDQHIEGMKIKQEVDAFAKKLNAGQMFEQWMKELKEYRNFDMSRERIFDIQVQQKSYELMINTDPLMVLFKEVRNLTTLNFRVPYSVKVMADEAKLNYPFAESLKQTARTYMAICHNALTPTTEMLVSANHAEIQSQISHGLHLTWESERLEGYTRKLCDSVYQFQEKIFELSKYVERMDRLIKEIDDIDVVVAPEDMPSAEDAGAGGYAALALKQKLDSGEEDEGNEDDDEETFNKKVKKGSGGDVEK